MCFITRISFRLFANVLQLVAVAKINKNITKMDRKTLIDLLDDFAFGSHDIEQTADRITELYKETKALQLQQTGVMRRSEQLVCDKCIKGLNNSKTFEKGTCVHCRNKV